MAGEGVRSREGRVGTLGRARVEGRRSVNGTLSAACGGEAVAWAEDRRPRTGSGDGDPEVRVLGSGAGFRMLSAQSQPQKGHGKEPHLRTRKSGGPGV